MTAAAAASAIVREAAASAVVDVLEGASEEEKAAKLASAKQEKMKKVIRYVAKSTLFSFFLSSLTAKLLSSEKPCKGEFYAKSTGTRQ